jgi:hypothetical protein
MNDRIIELQEERIENLRDAIKLIGCCAAFSFLLSLLLLAGVVWLILFFLGASGIL